MFHYPPVYHLLARAISLTGCTPLLAGRALSLAATFISAGAIAMLTYRLAEREAGRIASIIGGAIAGLSFFAFFPVIATSTVIRVDVLAITFSFIGLRCFTSSDIRSWRPFAGMAFFVLAVFTKQTSIAAPLAALTITGIVAPLQSLKLFGFGLVLGLIPLSILMWETTGGFLRHLVLYNINRFEFGLRWGNIFVQAPQIIFFAIAIFAVTMWWRRFPPSVKVGGLNTWRDVLGRDDQARAMVMVSAYLALLTLMLAGLGKSGATVGYFDEWMGVLSILIGYLVAVFASPGAAAGLFSDIRVSAAATLMLPVLLSVQVLKLPHKGPMNYSDQTQLRESRQLVDIIARADKPVHSGDMVLLMIAGKPVPWEPAIFQELASLWRWDESQLIRKIAAHDFAFVVMRDSTNFSPAVNRAIETAYPRVETLAKRTVHLPASSPSH